MSIKECADRINRHQSTISPGLPASFTGANTPGDEIAQGDLYLTLETSDRRPHDYVLVESPTDEHRQLVPESGQGSHHRLRHLDGVTIYRPTMWGNNPSLDGPWIEFRAPNAIVHEPGHERPHGTVDVPFASPESPVFIQCHYQRNLDAMERAIRAAD